MKIQILLIVSLLFFQACISNRKVVKPIKCENTLQQNLDNVSALIIASGYKEGMFSVTEKGFVMKRKSFLYAQLKKIKLVKKGDRRWVRIYDVNGVSMIYANDKKDIAINACYSLICLAEMNGALINGKIPEPIIKQDSGDKYDKLSKLKALLDSGAITQEEYEIEKKKILQ